MNNQLPPESEWKWRYYVAEIGVECFRIAKVWNDQPAANLTLEDNPKPLRLVTGGIEKFIESFIRDRLP